MSTWHRAISTRRGPPKKSTPSAPAPTPARPSSPPRWRWLLPAGIVIALMALVFVHPGAGGTPAQALTYTGFVGSDLAAIVEAPGAVSHQPAGRH